MGANRKIGVLLCVLWESAGLHRHWSSVDGHHQLKLLPCYWIWAEFRCEMVVLWLLSCFQQTWDDEIKQLLVISRIAWGFPIGDEGMDGCGPEQKAVFGHREAASRGTVHQLLLQVLCFYFCAAFRLSVLWKQKTSEGLPMCICIKHLLRRSVKKQWLGTNCEAEALTLFEYIAIILGVKLRIWPLWGCCLCPRDSTLCPRAAGTSETKFNKQTLSWLFIWVTALSVETWKNSFYCLKTRKSEPLGGSEGTSKVTAHSVSILTFWCQTPVKCKVMGKGPREPGGHRHRDGGLDPAGEDPWCLAVWGGGTPDALMQHGDVLFSVWSLGWWERRSQLDLFPVLKVTAMAFVAVIWIKQVPVLMGIQCGLSQQGRWLSGPDLTVWVCCTDVGRLRFLTSEFEACE